MTPGFPITRALAERPDLEQIKRQAKELLAAFNTGDAAACELIYTHFRNADAASFALHDAQLVLARSYGFKSWPTLKAYVDGVTVRRLVQAVRAGDIAEVRALLAARPELVHMDLAGNDEHRALHFAVMDRAPDMVRVLMEHGADARKGIYPHRDATSALTIARERGDDEIVAIIQETEQRRPAAKSAATQTEEAAPDELRDAIRKGDDDRAIALAQADPALSRAHPAISDDRGLLTLAIQHDRPKVLATLLELGLDPNEPRRVEALEPAQYSRGAPLWHCAARHQHALAELLLDHGADPNAQVYASGSPLFQAYGQRDRKMIELLERCGGVADAMTAGHYRLTELARRMLAGEIDGRLQDGMFAGRTLAEQLLWAAACGGDPEIVRMSLHRVDWPRDDPRWYRILEQPLRIWNHGAGHWTNDEWDRGTYRTCFHLVLEHCDPNVRGRFGLTILHDVAASRKHVTAEERLAFATMLLDSGARLDLRDDLLRSTPLGWACRWGRPELVELYLQRGVDPTEPDAAPWATPTAWAQKMGHEDVLAVLRGQGG